MINTLEFDNFESINEFKFCMSSNGGEVEFKWNGKEYSCTHIKENTICISEACKKETAFYSTNIEEILNYIIDGQKLRNIVKDIHIIFRSV